MKPANPSMKPPTLGLRKATPGVNDIDFRRLSDFVPGMIALYNLESGKYVYVNKTVEKLLGYSPKTFLQGGLEFVTSLVHPEDLPRIMAENQVALKAAMSAKPGSKGREPIATFEYRMRHRQGHWVWLHTDGSIYDWSSDGTVEHLINISIDITERKQAEEALRELATELKSDVREQAERLELALHASDVGMWEWNIKTGKLIWSNELKKIFGLKPTAKITYERYLQLLYPPDREQMTGIVKDAMKHGKTYSVEHRALWPDGSVHWIQGQGQAFLEDGKPVRMLGTCTNIDKRKQAELRVQESEERYQAFIRNSNEGIWRIEVDEPISMRLKPAQQIKLMYKYAYLAEANDTMAEMYGFDTSEALIGLRLGDLLVEHDPNNVAYLHAFIQSGYSLSGVDSHEIDANGKDKYFRNSLVGVMEGDMLVRAWGTQQDITEQRKAADVLAESEQRFRNMADTAPIFIWESGTDKRCTYFNKYWLEFTGRTIEQELGDGWAASVHPDDYERCMQTYVSSFDQQQPFSMEYRLKRFDGKYRWILDKGMPRFSPEGEFLGYIGSCVDIQDIKRERELKAKASLLAKQRAELLALNRAKDDFISLASHQLRTPATGVKQYVGMLLQGYMGTLSASQAEMLTRAEQSNERQLKIIDDLLKVASVDAGKFKLKKEKVDLAALLQDVITEQAESFATRHQRIRFESDVPNVVAHIDMSRIRMVLENMIDNASKYSPEDTEISVQVGRSETTATIQITDQGVGIAREDTSKLFHKFSRIDNPRSTLVGGTGLGLYLAQRIVQLHHGSIEVTSRLGRGSTFIIMLPLEQG